MEVEFLEKFDKDLDSINKPFVRKSILEVIESFETAQSIREVPNLKKLTGYRKAYRVRIGNYRLGVFAEGNKVQFARILHRKDVYKKFP